MTKDYILFKSEKYAVKKWIMINYIEELNEFITLCNKLNIEYTILFNFENKWIENDDYYLGGYELLDKVWEKLMED